MQEHILPGGYQLLGMCGNTRPERSLAIVERSEGRRTMPYLLWSQTQLPAQIKSGKATINTYSGPAGEAAVLRLDALTLRQVMATCGTLPPMLALRWAFSVCQMAIFYHRQQPAMVLTSTGRHAPAGLRISNLGELSASMSAEEGGEVPFELLPPMERPSVSADIYYVGALLAWMLRGTHGPLAAAPLPDHVPGRMAAVIEKAMAPRPDQRYATAQELADALAALLPQQPKQRQQPPRAWPIIAAMLAVMTAITLFIYGATNEQSVDAAPPSTMEARDAFHNTDPTIGLGAAPGQDLESEPDTLVINQLVQDEQYIDIYFSVLRDQEPVGGLRAEDIQLFENDVPVSDFTVGRVDSAKEPVTVMLVMDVSGSMGPSRLGLRDGALDAAILAAQDFISHIPAGSDIGLITFSSTVTIEHGLTSDANAISARIGALQPGGQTAVYDGLGTALQQLEGQTGRSMVLLLSDGGDTASTSWDAAKVAESARTTNIPIFTIGLLSAEFDGAALQQLSEQSGAQMLTAPSKEDLTGLYSVIFKQIDGQYHVRYRTAQPLTPGTEITVRLQLREEIATLDSSKILVVR